MCFESDEADSEFVEAARRTAAGREMGVVRADRRGFLCSACGRVHIRAVSVEPAAIRELAAAN